MQSPTCAQLCNAIEVPAKLGERLNTETVYTVTQLPDTQFADDYVASAEEKTTHIEKVDAHLRNWRGATEALCS